ncbi:MAG: hypothetical protein IJC86_05870 [Clostridia bacterium]|nr:hypothetical protein [Clostridia bacterium]
MSKEMNTEKNKDITIDSIIEETRFLSEKEKMEKEAKRISGGPKMEEIYSNTSKEVRLTNHNPLDEDPDEDMETEQDTQDENSEDSAPQKDSADAPEETPQEPDTVVTLSPEYDEDTTISEDIIDNVDSFNVRSIKMKDVDSIDISLDEDEEEDTDPSLKHLAQATETETPQEEEDNPEGISDFERLFGKPKPVCAVQTVVSKVPVYQHESKVEKVHVRAGKFSTVVETEYKKYLSSPNPVISQSLKPMPETETEEGEKPTPKKVLKGISGKIIGFFSSPDDDPDDFKEKTIQIEDYRSHQDAKSIVEEVNANIRKMFVNSAFTGVLAALSLILTILGRVLCELISKSYIAALVLAIINLALLLMSCWVCRVTIINGLSALKRFKGNSDTGASVAAVAGVIQAILAVIIPAEFFSGAQYLYTTVAIIALLLNNLGKLFMVRRVKENFKFVSAKNPAYAAKIYTNEDIARQLMSGTTQDKPIIAYQHKTDFLGDFLRLSYSPDPSEDMASKLAPVTLLCSLFVAIIYGFVAQDPLGALSALAVMCCVSAPVCDLLAVNLPMYRLSKDALSKNAMISGYPSVRQFCDTKAVICEASDLYPASSITLNGVKAFSNYHVEDCLLSAAAILKEARNPMASVFDHVVQSQNKPLPKVESVLYEDKLGLVGWVEGERILVGSRALLEKYAIAPPSEDFEEKYKIEGRSVTYLTRSGELVAMFVTTYATTLRIAELLQKAEANGISLLVRNSDCNITGEKIADDFGIYFRSVKVLSTGLSNVCQEITSATEDTSRAYLATRGSFMSLLRAVAGCVKLKSNISLSIIIQLIGIILGVLVMATITLFAGVEAVKNIEVMLYILFWAAAAVIAPSIQKP